MTEHSYKYSITRITDDITTVVETDDRAFAYEFTHGMPEIGVEPDCTGEVLKDYRKEIKNFG